MARGLRIGLAFLICFGLAGPVRAERPPRTPVVFLDIQQGLSNNTVRCILRDHYGFLWFGTRDGLNRYDGNTFTVFRHQFRDTNSLLCNYVLSLLEDRSGKLWIGTRQGLCTYDPLTGRFAKVDGMDPGGGITPVSDVIKELSNDENGNIFIGTEETGLLIYRPGAAAAERIALGYGAAAAFQYGIHAIKADGSRIWVQVQKKGLCVFDSAAGCLRVVNTELPLAGSLEVSGHVLRAAAGGNLYRYDPVSNVFTRIWKLPADRYGRDDIRVLKDDGKGRLLVGTANGRVLSWDIAAGRMLPYPPGDSTTALQNGTIYALCIGDGGSEWIGTAKGGIGVIDPQRSRFHTISHLPGVDGSPARFVTCFAETRDSNLLVGTEGDGILLYDRRREHLTRLRNRSGDIAAADDKVISMCADSTGHVWLAEQAGGIGRIDLHTGHTEHYYCNRTLSGQESNWVWVVYGDRRHTVWATTLREVSLMGGLYRYDPAANGFKIFDANLSDIFTLYEDREGQLWGGNLNQLVAIDRIGHHHRYYPVGAPVRCIYEDKAGRLWLGTEGGGLLLFDRHRQTITAWYTTDAGLCNNTVNAILEDVSGTLWLSTAYGLSRFNPATARFRNYYESDGLQSNEFIYNSALALRSGEFAFGGIKGFNLFDPAGIDEMRRMPRLMLTGITVNGVPIKKDTALVKKWGSSQVEEIRVPYDKAFLSLDFTALEFSAPQEIAYSYFMEGWDRKWTDAGRRREATYTHLEPGNYIFRVRNTNAEGRWNPAEIRLGITVLPPWYRTVWAYAFYILAFIGLVYVYLHYKTRQARLTYEVAVAKLTAEKERAEHEKRIGFFTNIAHEFRTPLTLIINPVKDLLNKSAAKDPAVHPETGFEQAELQVVHRNARRMLSLVDQILLFRKADSGADRLITTRLNVIDLGREVFLSFTHQARTRQINYTFDCNGQTLEIVADREKLEIILFNLVSNALKYTPAGGDVRLTIGEWHGAIEVRVTDSGPGIPAAAGDKIFDRFYQSPAVQAERRPKAGFGIGLFLARQFAVAHKGSLTYSSREGAGTTFILQLPKGLDYSAAAPAEQIDHPGELFQELLTAEAVVISPEAVEEAAVHPEPLVDEKRSMLIIDDDQALRHYIASIFRPGLTIYEAEDGAEGLRQALEHLPDVVISDIRMLGINGIDVCKALKGNPVSRHIPVILLTGTPMPETELQGTEGGADLYLTKPFDSDLLRAKVTNLLQSRKSLREALFNEVTHNQPVRGISDADKAFLEKCVSIIEAHLDEEDFAIAGLAMEIGVSHSSLYKRVKGLTGQSLNAFIRQIRLRNAAILCINTDLNVNEIAARVGVIDRTHFREQFQKVYGMTAAEYIRKFRKPLSARYTINKNK